MSAIDDWAAEMHAAGRVLTRYPRGLLKGQLASRAAVSDSSLVEDASDPTGWNEWDYQLAPFAARVEDNWSDTVAEVTQGATVSDVVSDVAAGTGAIVHEAFKDVGSAVAAAIGIPPWLLWAGVAYGVYFAVTNPARVRGYVRQVTG